MTPKSNENRFMASLMKNSRGIVLIIFSALALASGQLFWKEYGFDSLFFLLVGFVIYAAGGLFMMMAFRHGSFSVIHPMMSMGYVFAVVFGVFLLGEGMTILAIIGVSVIILGNLLIGIGDE